jgi:hypothetical protein
MLGAERRPVLAVLRRFGWNSTSFQVVEPGFRSLFVDDDACVAYVDTGQAWVAAGEPLGAPGRLREVAACGPTWTAARPGPRDGATGSPSVVEPLRVGCSATALLPPRCRSTSAGQRPPRLSLEEHGRLSRIEPHLPSQPVQQGGQLPAL